MKRFCLLSIFSFVILTSVAAHADSIAKAYSVQGKVEGRFSGAANWSPVNKGTEFSDGDFIRTGSGARAGLKFTGGKLVRLRENSQLRITGPNNGTGKKGKLGLLDGVIHLFSRKSQDFPEVETAEVSATIRGTEFVVARGNNETTVTVLSGQVKLNNQHGSSTVNKGEEGSTQAGSSPRKALLASPIDAVQWALHYPIFSSSRSSQAGSTPAEKAYREAASLLRSGEVGSALSALNRAGKLPGVGSEVRAKIAAQKAIIAVTQNRKKEARTHSEQALQHSSTSVPALYAKAYVEQAHQNIEGAREALEEAFRLDSSNGEVLARLAEIKLGMGENKEALADAKRAVELTPQSEYTHTVLGFANLTRYNTEAAQAAFTDALSLNSASGLPHFGIGLAKIRAGDLGGGRSDLEQAVHLEPARALFRSYLGKAFFEETDEELAQEEYRLAISLDPEDPTPYLYRAFNELSQNRPVAALKDVEESIKRNNARAVYRSSSLLDQDLAVRTTSLAEVFNQLGFSEVSRLEAIKSINRDYTNFSAHRLLAESYDGAFFGDAQFTEGIIADLLSPVSFNVFQNFDGFRTESSLNEYSALFDRPEHRAKVNGSWTSNDDLVEASAIQTGKFDRFGYRFGYATAYGNGRKKDGVYTRQHIFDTALQYQLTHDDRVLLQSAYKKRENSDLDFGDELEDFEVSLGSHHKLSHRSQVLTRVELLNRNLGSFDDTVVEEAEQSLIIDGMPFSLGSTDLFLDQASDEDFLSLRGSAQWLFDTSLVDLIFGGQYLYSNGAADEASLITDDSVGFFTELNRQIASEANYNADSYSAYTYSTWHVARWVDVNLGANFTEIQLPGYDVIPPFVDGTRSENKISPKVGMTFYPTDDLTVRSAYFQSLGISTISDIGTIEPTLVGSFNQLLGDLPGAETENWGIGVDQKFPGQAYFGAEYIYRDIERDGISITNALTVDVDSTLELQDFLSTTNEEREREHLLRTYLYGVFSDAVTGTLDYRRELLEALDIDEKNETDRVTFGLNYFDCARWFASSRASWIHQRISDTSGLDNGTEEFWLVDFGMGYRLPKRRGSIQFVLRNLLDEEFVFDDRGRSTQIFSGFNGAIELSLNL